jgi:hypothetical protein
LPKVSWAFSISLKSSCASIVAAVTAGQGLIVV